MNTCSVIAMWVVCVVGEKIVIPPPLPWQEPPDLIVVPDDVLELVELVRELDLGPVVFVDNGIDYAVE